MISDAVATGHLPVIARAWLASPEKLKHRRVAGSRRRRLGEAAWQAVAKEIIEVSYGENAGVCMDVWADILHGDVFAPLAEEDAEGETAGGTTPPEANCRPSTVTPCPRPVLSFPHWHGGWGVTMGRPRRGMRTRRSWISRSPFVKPNRRAAENGAAPRRRTCGMMWFA